MHGMAGPPTSTDHTRADTAELQIENTSAEKMVQEFMVVRCYQCETFQVQQVKKVNKWNCKCCNEKQSVVKVYGQGKAADCRKHVQKLNLMRRDQDQNDAHTISNHPPEDYASTFTLDEAGVREEQPDHPVVVAGKTGGKSKWTTFIEVQDSDEEDKEDTYTTDKAAFTQASKRVKRSESDRVKSRSGKQTTPTDKVVPYSSISHEMEAFLDDHTPSISTSKSLHTLTHESYRRLDRSEATPTSDTQSRSMLDLRGHDHHDDIESIRQDISRFSRPLPPDEEVKGEIPKVSSRWSKFMCEEEESGDEGCGLEGGRSRHLLTDKTTVAQFTMLTQRK